MRWLVDERPPTWWARAYVAGMRLRRDDEAFRGEAHTRRVAEDLQADGDAPPDRWTRATLRVDEHRLRGMRVWRAAPRRARPRVRVVYLHGGGYVHPLTPDYWRLVRALAAADAEVVVPAYPLAPRHTAAEVVPRLTDLVEDVDDGSSLVLMGDSAGGALALVLAQRLRDAGSATVPARVVALSPWLDPALADPEVDDLEPTDPMLHESGLRAAARWWAGERSVDDPLLCPLSASLAGLPPVDLHIGDHDILRPAVDRLAALAREQGADLTVWEKRSMFHVWMTRQLPEGRETRRALRATVARAGQPKRPLT